MIDNHIEVTHALARFNKLRPTGEYAPVIVDNPRSNRGTPDYLRVSVPRKGYNFNVIEQINEFGLSVADVWQHDADRKEDRIHLKIE